MGALINVFTRNRNGNQHESFTGEETCFGSCCNSLRVRLASRLVRQETPTAVQPPCEQEMTLYLGRCVDNGNIIPILKGPSDSNSTNSQKQGPAGELENRGEERA